MIFTARQLEELHRSNGHVTLPYRARLTPLAQDWLRQHKIAIGYSDVDTSSGRKKAEAAGGAVTGGTWMWWCDGPCGPAKAALLSVAREAALQANEIAVDPKRTAEAVRIIAREIKAGRASGAILLVSNGSAAMVFANRCPSLRAIPGTSIEAVDQGIKLVAANVIVIEYPNKSLQQTRTLLSKFVRGQRELSDDVKKQLSELSTCE
jgi:hypothetical protein